ncbi:unnamed protein product, partial [Musa hybrid cultivar]
MVEQTRQQRKAERPLLSLQHRLACSGAAGFQPTNGVGNDGKDEQVDCSSNPFLAPPLSYGEKEASEITGPQEADAGKSLSVPEACTPAMRKEAKVGSFVFDTNGEKILPRSRPTVHFKIKIRVDNQSAAASPFSSERDSLLLSNDEKDDRRK